MLLLARFQLLLSVCHHAKGVNIFSHDRKFNEISYPTKATSYLDLLHSWVLLSKFIYSLLYLVINQSEICV